MKFLQIIQIPNWFLDQYNRMNAENCHLSYKEQITLLSNQIADCTSIITPYLSQMGYECTLLIPDYKQLQLKWTVENNISIDHNIWKYSILSRQIEHYKPDILYFSETNDYDSHFLKKLSWKPTLICSYCNSNMCLQQDWREFDLILSCSQAVINKAKQHVMNTSFFFHGFQSRINNTLNNIEKQTDIVFAGKVPDDLSHISVQSLLDVGKEPLGWEGQLSINYFLDAQSQDLANFPAGIVMYDKGSKYGLDYYHALKMGRIALNPIIDDEFDRCIKITGAGTFMLANKNKNLDQLFTSGTEYETYQNKAELIEKIHYYIDHPEKRELIAAKGQQKCIKDYSIEIKMNELNSLFQNCLKNRFPKVMPGTAICYQTKNNRISGYRTIPEYNLSDGQKWLEHARSCFNTGKINEAFDIYEQLSIEYQEQSIDILAEAYDLYQKILHYDHYRLYQSRHYDFGIRPSDKVLDIGNGHSPFILASHLADISLSDHYDGSSEDPVKYVDEKPVYACNIENLTFNDKEFDFVYCSHVIEFAKTPDKACEEIMRIAKRGFIETSTQGKDLWLNNGKNRKHQWIVVNKCNRLIFKEYSPSAIEELQNIILKDFYHSPRNKREKAFSALVLLKPDLVNTMLLWEGRFQYEVCHREQ
jgi:ubiquinone/menaquinone biosynthesis C-methylase UbiE